MTRKLRSGSRSFHSVMRGRVPRIHDFLRTSKTLMAATSAAMTPHRFNAVLRFAKALDTTAQLWLERADRLRCSSREGVENLRIGARCGLWYRSSGRCQYIISRGK